MFKEHTFYVSVSKKHTQSEVFGFERKTQFDDQDNPSDEYIRYAAARRFCQDECIPVEYRGPEYWVSAVCISN